MTKLFSPLMGVIYGAISAILLFWHAAWHKVLGNSSWLGTNWSWVLGIIFVGGLTIWLFYGAQF